MSAAKLTAGAVVTALALSACGVKAKPVAGTPAAAETAQQHLYSQLTTHEQCLKQKHIPYHQKLRDGSPKIIQVMTRPTGPTVEYQATPGAAQNAQIQGQSQGAEVIGSALLYPNGASDKLLNTVEACIAKGVSG